MTYSELWRRLVPQYDEREAKAVARTLLEDVFKLSLTDLYTDGLERLTDAEISLLNNLFNRLEQGEPVQYVTGKASFCGREFKVNPAVLIPRPETELLCQTVISAFNAPYCALQPPEPLRVLDVGTGSGCIAVTLALDLWNSAITAWDISSDALLTARENAHRLQARVNFELHDVLQLDKAAFEADPFDVIVSNPPYICERERSDMAPHVLLHEPPSALFVPDDDPLIFYHAIARYALRRLKPSGLLAFEINPLYAEALRKMLEKMGFKAVDVKKDPYGRERVITAQKPLPAPSKEERPKRTN